MSADQNTTIRESYLERNRTHNEIRRGGAIGNLNDGIEITTHGISTRLIAWPGNGFQTESVHILTHHPGDETPMYSYGMAEEAMLCLKGEGEVFLRGLMSVHHLYTDAPKYKRVHTSTPDIQTA